MYDHAELAPVGLRSPMLPAVAPGEDASLFKTTLFGPTCDGLDTVARDVPLPRLRNGDWVLFPRFGAYTIAGAQCCCVGQRPAAICVCVRAWVLLRSCNAWAAVLQVEPTWPPTTSHMLTGPALSHAPSACRRRQLQRL